MSKEDLKLVVVYNIEEPDEYDDEEDIDNEFDADDLDCIFLPNGRRALPEKCAVGEKVSFICGSIVCFDTSHREIFEGLAQMSRKGSPRKVQDWINAQAKKPTLEAITTYALLEAPDLTMSDLTKILVDNKFISHNALSVVEQKRKERDGK